MDRQQLRLELLRLTYSHGRETSETLKRAKELETYVYEQETAAIPVPKRQTGSRPKHGNPVTGRKTAG